MRSFASVTIGRCNQCTARIDRDPNGELAVKICCAATDSRGVNSSFLTNVRRAIGLQQVPFSGEPAPLTEGSSGSEGLYRTVSLKLGSPSNASNGLSSVLRKGSKGLLVATAIGIAGSIASSMTVPQDPASAALKVVKPKASPKTTASPTQTAKTYLVRSGDSLSAISVAKNTTVSALAQANKLSTTAKLQIGQSLLLPKPKLYGPKGLPARLRANPKRLAVRKHTAKWAKANNIPQDLLEATLWQESGFDQSKVSSTGAIGVGQIMPDTAGFIEKELIGVDLNPRVTENNVRMSARYLRYLLKHNQSSTTKALHAYYQGMGSIRENGLYDDTIRYARNVQALRRQFEE